MLTSTPTTILVLGTDGGTQSGRAGARRSDSIMLIRTDPGKHRLAFLSIPRDLRVEIPGNGTNKINAAFQLGGPTLALQTVKSLTGLDINHVAFVDFDRFRELIDSVGGIDVNVPRPILSNRFDCPYKTSARCQAWDGWRFEKGPQHMNGERALVYSRIRENRLDASETDLDRARRQQQVIQATADKVTSFGTGPQAPVPRRFDRQAAGHRSQCRPDTPARLGVLPREQGARPPLQARRRARQRRRPIGHLRLRGQRRHDRDVHRALGASASAEGCSLRAGMRDRRPQVVTGGSQSAAAVFLSLEPESFLSLEPESFEDSFFSPLSLFSPAPPPSPSFAPPLRDARP